MVTDCSIFMLSTVLQLFFKSAVLNFPLNFLSDYPTKVISSFKSQLFYSFFTVADSNIIKKEVLLCGCWLQYIHSYSLSDSVKIFI